MQSFAGKSFPEGAVVKQLGQNWRNAFVLAGPKTAGVLELCTSGTSVIEMPMYHTLVKATHISLSFMAHEFALEFEVQSFSFS